MFSVVIPLYNKAHTIRKTLDSVLNQTYQDFEVIIVDDGSTDNGIEVIKESFNNKRIQIISQPNQGVSVARNTGIQNANGKWISFLDADDLWREDYLENINEAIQKFPDCNYILGGRRVLNLSDNTSFSFIPANMYKKVEIIDFFQNPHIFAHISSSTVNRDFLKRTKISFISGQRFHEDFTFIFRIALNTPVCYIGLPLVTYCGGVAGQATSNLKSNTRLEDGALFRNKVLEAWISCNKANKLLPIFMKYETRHAILNYLKTSDYDSLNYLMDNLSETYKRILFSKLELSLYRHHCLKIISLYWIKYTKLLWRMHRFPRVNVK